MLGLKLKGLGSCSHHTRQYSATSLRKPRWLDLCLCATARQLTGNLIAYLQGSALALVLYSSPATGIVDRLRGKPQLRVVNPLSQSSGTILKEKEV